MVFFSKSVFGTVSGCYNSQYKGKFAFNALFFCNAFLNYNNIKRSPRCHNSKQDKVTAVCTSNSCIKHKRLHH